MKKLILGLIIPGIAFNALAQKVQEKFTLNGKLAGKKEGSLYLRYSDKDDKDILDSSLIRNGNFSFYGSITEPTIAGFTLNDDKNIEHNTATIWLEPVVMNMKVRLNEFKEAIITGSTTHEEYAKLEKARKLIRKKYKLQLDSLPELKDKEKIASIRERLTPYFLEMDQAELGFFDKHPQSYVTAYWMRYHVSKVSLDSLKMFYDRMGEKLQVSPAGKYLVKKMEKLAGGSPGSKAKDFIATDINGNILRLSDLKGKYILLDFWASWCVPCRKGNPHLIKLYNQYKAKGIEFIGVSSDTDPIAWRKAVQKDGLPWQHVLGFEKEKRLKGIKNENDVDMLFGIYSLPTKILIDPNGVIIGRFSEEETELDAMLNKIFDK